MFGGEMQGKSPNPATSFRRRPESSFKTTVIPAQAGIRFLNHEEHQDHGTSSYLQKQVTL